MQYGHRIASGIGVGEGQTPTFYHKARRFYGREGNTRASGYGLLQEKVSAWYRAIEGRNRYNRRFPRLAELPDLVQEFCRSLSLPVDDDKVGAAFRQ